MKKSYLLLACLALIVSSCCGCRVPNSQQKKMLGVNDWQLIEINGDREFQGDSPDSYTLSFDRKDGKIYGKGSCNRFFGNFTTSGKNGIAIQPGGMTMMMCPNIQTESDFVKTIGEADEFYFEDNVLMLFRKGEVIAKFRPIPKSAANDPA